MFELRTHVVVVVLPHTPDAPDACPAAALAGENPTCGTAENALLNVTVAMTAEAVGDVPVVNVRRKPRSVPTTLIVGDVPAPAPATTVGVAEVPMILGKLTAPVVTTDVTAGEPRTT